MSATERVAAFGSRSTISGWAAISPSQKSSRFAHHRVHRRLDYPASLGLDQSSTQITRSAVATSNSNKAMTSEFEGGSLLLSTVESGWRRAMIPCRYAVSSLVAITVFLAVGFTCGADPPTLEEL